jgi:hypothetical protein
VHCDIDRTQDEGSCIDTVVLVIGVVSAVVIVAIIVRGRVAPAGIN